MTYYDVLKQMKVEVEETFQPGPAVAPRDTVESLRIERGVKPPAVAPKRRDELLHLVQQLFLDTRRKPLKQVLFCGVDSNDSSEVCAGAGIVLAEQVTDRVCLVDANMRDTQLSRFFHLADPGRTSSLNARRPQCTRVDSNLFVAGVPLLADSHGDMLPSGELRRTITMMAANFEYLLFHGAGVNTSTDPLILGQILGSAVLVMASRETRRDAAQKAKSRLEVSSTRVLGTVLT